MDKQEVKQVAKWDYDVIKFKSADEVLDFAIGREIDAQSFYMKLSSIVKDKKLVKTLIDLAAEELEHETKLHAVRLGKAAIGTLEVGKLNIVDYAKDVVPTPEMTYADLLVIGMKKEETSRRLYAELAEIVEQPDLKNLFTRLAHEEADHKLRFELEYDLTTF
ncbi:MAG: ferritin family protein [Phycisphaerae bacterium]|jgi:rubrerythrin